ncbi:hypothetical protein FN846DRAFT_887409 [Sphaerosporella brunnea]|uniref:Uncharacterized protein n=1 Tax=Sphaerosporella brunnea TaxID=1250544 RepID=A0A5J5F723_9PEZI|nr:hypothetical protein FN846DRAFT_887409 [Sphaerosporella brunnea]
MNFYNRDEADEDEGGTLSGAESRTTRRRRRRRSKRMSETVKRPRLRRPRMKSCEMLPGDLQEEQHLSFRSTHHGAKRGVSQSTLLPSIVPLENTFNTKRSLCRPTQRASSDGTPLQELWVSAGDILGLCNPLSKPQVLPRAYAPQGGLMTVTPLCSRAGAQCCTRVENPRRGSRSRENRAVSKCLAGLVAVSTVLVRSRHSRCYDSVFIVMVLAHLGAPARPSAQFTMQTGSSPAPERFSPGPAWSREAAVIVGQYRHFRASSTVLGVSRSFPEGSNFGGFLSFHLYTSQHRSTSNRPVPSRVNVSFVSLLLPCHPGCQCRCYRCHQNADSKRRDAEAQSDVPELPKMCVLEDNTDNDGEEAGSDAADVADVTGVFDALLVYDLHVRVAVGIPAVERGEDRGGQSKLRRSQCLTILMLNFRVSGDVAANAQSL